MVDSARPSEWLEAILHNNVGVESMLHSELRRGALQLLGRALTALKTEGSDQANFALQFAMNEESRQSKVSAELSLENILILPPTRTLRESYDGQGGSDCPMRTFIYQQPMRLGVKAGASILSAGIPTATRNAIHTLLSSVIVFNLAMTIHLLALEDYSKSCMGVEGIPALALDGEFAAKESTKLLLGRAINLYVLAMQLIHGAARHQANDLMYVASLNNLAQAYWMYGDAAKSEECFQKLMSLVLLHADARMMDRGAVNLPLDLLEGFWFNLSRLVFPPGMPTQSALAA